MKSGGYGYIPLSTESSAGVGDTLDKDEIVILTLERVGNDPIYRVDTKQIHLSVNKGDFGPLYFLDVRRH